MAEIVIVGAGPAGIAAAVSASSCGAEVVLLDDNTAVGGQIWRGGHSELRLRHSRVRVVTGARVISGDAGARTLTVETPDDSFTVSYRKLILATGARELFLPFPGWTSPGVFGVGGLQALTKSGLSVAGKTILVAGTGPFLLAAAAHFRRQGARVPIIAEQAPRSEIFHLGRRLFRYPGKLFEAARLRWQLRRTRYLASCWVEKANGGVAVLHRGSRTWQERFDFLATGYGFCPNTELAALLSCDIRNHSVLVDSMQRTSSEEIYAAGECTGIGGVDLSLVEGQIAGLAACSEIERATCLHKRRRQILSFAEALDSTFRLRSELRNLPQDDTVICRCEDVRWQSLRRLRSRREGKLYTRCGMGPCQGRICGPILDFLGGTDHDRVRPPVFPARLETLASANREELIRG